MARTKILGTDAANSLNGTDADEAIHGRSGNDTISAWGGGDYDLADPSAFYNAATGLGFQGGELYLNGEESGTEGLAFAHIASGNNAGHSFELPGMGNMAFENLVANPGTGDKPVVAALDDEQNGQVYFCFGDKQPTGSAVDRAGADGRLPVRASGPRPRHTPAADNTRATARPWATTTNRLSRRSISVM